ncbi:Uncharacterized protein HZ326_12229 [Fusarium oxysporum f. sp. albedinis]|nr:Uncharacterized protein HZ326_12229 [Fusarium oxysporum f. sp. albedinis]
MGSRAGILPTLVQLSSELSRVKWANDGMHGPLSGTRCANEEDAECYRTPSYLASAPFHLCYTLHTSKPLLEPHFMPHKLVLPNGFLALILGQTEACDLEVWTALSKSQPFGPLTAESILKRASP